LLSFIFILTLSDTAFADLNTGFVAHYLFDGNAYDGTIFKTYLNGQLLHSTNQIFSRRTEQPTFDIW